MMRVPPLAQTAHAHQVVGSKAHQCLARKFGLTDEFGLGMRPVNRMRPVNPS